ncbi:DUF1501 domain-containing protein [Achromobacter sp.]|uniref:DUF1501 domain-containing protein n=1 Tax=Achromobacter sp. TaxID=134375 RepID=UPI0028B21302|nr:DUF1501 domain-containing protein [Achromobacter sp.]
MDRRRLLQLMAAAPLVLGGSRIYAAPAASGNRLLVVFMRGAYDAASLLVPANSDFYYESRPNISIPRPGAGPDSALPLADDWALHPGLAESLLPFYKKRQLVFVPFAGTEDLSRSHFETQNSIERGLGAQLPGNDQSGFLNRLATALTNTQARPAAFTSEIPQIFRGGVRVPNVDLQEAAGRSRLSTEESRIIASMYEGTDLHASVMEGQDVMNVARGDIAAEMRAANGNAVSMDGLERTIRRIARFMTDRYNLGFVDVGGWDTHVGQGAASGGLANRLGQLGRALAAYAEEMGPAWRQTTVVVISEFGRTFRENGNKGTDHGHGTVYWVMGGNVQGGRIAGRQVAVKRDTLFQDRDYPVLNEYRAVFAGLFSRLYGLDKARLAQVFPGVAPLDLKLV